MPDRISNSPINNSYYSSYVNAVNSKNHFIQIEDDGN